MFYTPATAARFDPNRPMTQLLSDSQDCRVIVLGLNPGQFVTPHSSSSTVLIQVLDGTGLIQVGDREQAVNAGELAVCPPNVSLSIRANDCSRLTVLAVIAPQP